MREIKVKIKKIRKDAQVPNIATNGSAGADVSACLWDDIEGKMNKIIIAPGNKAKIGTGLAFQLPKNHAMYIIPRSSMGIKKGLVLQNTIGLLDSDYTGELLLFVKNTGDANIQIEDGERLAQLVVLPYPTVEYIEVDELDKTERGDGGFGSTGTK